MRNWNHINLGRTLALAFVLLATQASAQTPIIVDWTLDDFTDSAANIVPMPHYGDTQNKRFDHLDTYALVEAQGLPVVTMMRNTTAPVTGAFHWALNDLMTPGDGGVSRLDYVFADYESATDDQDVLDTINLVRSNPDPAYNQARIGNYRDYPVAIDPTLPFSSQHDRTGEANFYLSSGLDIAQPNAYPYEYFVNHFNRPDQHATLSPSKRSALFWAPLERVSLTKKVLPQGHLLIPWVAGFISWDNYEADPPEKIDLDALIQHLRLRGSDGYATFRSKLYTDADNGSYGSWIDSYSDDDYRVDALLAWEDLDDIYAVPGDTTILNLETDKTVGVEWSGIQRGDQVEIIISNLSSSSVALDLPDIAGLPDFADPVAAGTHQRFRYTATIATPGDFDFDSDVDGADFLLWQRNGGSVNDLSDWQAGFGTGTLSAAQSVPEPSSLLLSMSLIFWSGRRNRRN